MQQDPNYESYSLDELYDARVAAFLFDYLAISVGWMVVDNLITTHMAADDNYEGVSIMVHTGRGLMSLGEATYRER